MATNEEIRKHIEKIRRLRRNFGYVCPQCGNNEKFRQYYHIVKNVVCDTSEGKIIYSEVEKSDESLMPRVVAVECAECGADAVICDKGVVISCLDHDSGVGE